MIRQRIHNDVEEKLVLDNFKYNHYRCAWYSFIQLLDIDYTESFICDKCGVDEFGEHVTPVIVYFLRI